MIIFFTITKSSLNMQYYFFIGDLIDLIFLISRVVLELKYVWDLSFKFRPFVKPQISLKPIRFGTPSTTMLLISCYPPPYFWRELPGNVSHRTKNKIDCKSSNGLKLCKLYIYFTMKCINVAENSFARLWAISVG